MLNVYNSVCTTLQICSVTESALYVAHRGPGKGQRGPSPRAHLLLFLRAGYGPFPLSTWVWPPPFFNLPGSAPRPEVYWLDWFLVE